MGPGARGEELGPHRASALRSGAGAQRRLRPARGVHERGAVRGRAARHAPPLGRAVADPGDARRERGLRRRARARRDDRASRRRGRAGRRHGGRGDVAAREGRGGPCGLRHRRRRPPRRVLPAAPHASGLCERARVRPGSGSPLRSPRAAPLPGRAARTLAQARLAACRRVPDPQPAAPRPCRARPRGHARVRGEPSRSSGRGGDRARRYRSLHPGALLP